MKRGRGPTRRTRLTRSPIARGTTRIATGNPARQAKRRKRYSALLAAYRRSPTHRVVELRAGGQCERVVGADRCEYRGPLIHNHRTYARFGGQELPSDVEAICPAHNSEYEGARPWRRRGMR